jgi:Protein of unknown function (DUF3501)
MSLIRPIVRADIKGPVLYGPIRDDFRARIIELKKPRRVIVGDRVELVFDNRLTLQFQVEEICRVENLRTDEQIQAEIDQTNVLMPDASSIAGTLFIPVGTGPEARRQLDELIGLDEHVVLHIGPHALRAAFEPGRATADRIAAVQYVRFPLGDALPALRTPGTALALEIDHPNYRHRVALDEATRASLAKDYE